jgi:hypothetical protein
MIRRALILILAAAALLPVATADAKVTKKKANWGPLEVEAESQFGTYRDLGAGIYMMRLQWDEIAFLEPLDARDPLDASYEWPDDVDTALAEARPKGIAVGLSVTGLPDWSSAKRTGDLADFLTAAARRYKRVHLWSIWENPSKTFTAPRYARALDKSYAALKARSKRNVVVGGNSTGSSASRWLRGLKLPNGKRPRMDLYGHDAGSKLTNSEVNKLAREAKHRLFVTLAVKKSSRQASRVKSALKVARRSKRVATLAYDGLYDDQSATGLLNPDGSKRAAFNAFKKN